jgi:hypothetical protein
MVRSRWIKTVLAALVSTGVAWSQPAVPSSPAVKDDPTGRIITVAEAGKPAQKCKVVKWWVDDKGQRNLQVTALGTGDVMTIVEYGPTAVGEMPAPGRPRSVGSRIFHWGRDHTPPPGTPLPPDMIAGPVIVNEKYISADGSPVPPDVMHGPAATPMVVEGAPPPAPPRLMDRIFHRNTAPADVAATDTGAEPVRKGGWRESWGKTDTPKKAVADAGKKPDALPAPGELPHADAKKPDPLTDPSFQRPLEVKAPAKPDPAKIDDKSKVTAASLPPPPAPKPELPPVKPAAAPPPAPAEGEKLPAGAKSVLASGAVQYIPVPVVTLPDVRRPVPPGPPPPPQWNIPQPPYIAPQRTNSPTGFGGGLAVNAFTPLEDIPPEPGTQMASLTSNAFSGNFGIQQAPGYGGAAGLPPAPVPGTFGGVPYGYPQACPPGTARGPYPPAMPPAYARMNPAMPPGSPFGPVVRMPAPPANPYGMQGQGVVPAGYQGMAGVGVAHVASYGPGPGSMPATPAGAAGTPQLLTVLRDSLYPSQREWAAEKLSALDWKTNEPVVLALVQAAREDPAATVRAGCIHALAQMKANTMPVVTTVQALKADADPRVRNEAEQALAVLAPAGSAAASPVQPVSAVSPAPAPLPGSASPSLPPLPSLPGSH